MAMLITFVMGIATFFSCGQVRHDGRLDDSTRLAMFQRLDDSIVALSSTSLPIIERGLRESTDSIGYYEYFLRLANYYWLSETPSRVEPCVRRIVAYCNSRLNEENSSLDDATRQRLNSILAGALVCQAAYNHNFHRDLSDGSVGLYVRAIDLLAHSDSKRNLPKTCANLADAYIQCNDVPAAAKWYRRALFLVDSLRLPDKENVTLYMGLAQIYQTLGDNAKALDYYHATERHYNDMSPAMKGYLLCSMGNLYYFTKQYGLSLKMFLRMRKELECHGMDKKFDMYLCKVNLADVYLNLDSISQSKRLLAEVEPYFKGVGDTTAIYYCNTIRMGIAMHEGDAALARNVLAAERIDDKKVSYTMVNIRNRYLRQYYELTGDYHKAYDNLRADIRYSDSLEHNRSNMRSAEIMARFRADTLQLHHDLALEHKNAAIHRSNMLLTLILSIATVMALLTLAWILYLRKRRFEDHVNIMELKLLNMRNRISPHFVFNVINNKLGSSDEKEETELVALTRLIRTNLDLSMKPSVSLEQELGYLRKYVDVESYLLGDDFCFHIDIPDNIDTKRLMGPSMFLQILTENAIKHGLKGWEGHKELRIVVRREPINAKSTAPGSPMQTVVSVLDNGPGFNPQSLKKSTGLGVITQTIAITNERNKHKMRFDIHNIVEDGHVGGCIATLKVPDGMRF